MGLPKQLLHYKLLHHPVETTIANNNPDQSVTVADASVLPMLDQLGNALRTVIGGEGTPGLYLSKEGWLLWYGDTDNPIVDDVSTNIRVAFSLLSFDDYSPNANTQGTTPYFISTTSGYAGHTYWRRFTSGTNTEAISIDGGTTYGPESVDLTTLSDGDGYRMESADGSVVVYNIRNSTGLPASTSSAAMSISKTDTKLQMAFLKNVAGTVTPLLPNDAEIANGTDIKFYVPYVQNISLDTIEAQANSLYYSGNDISPTPAALDVDWDANWRHVEELTITAQNTVNNLTYTPVGEIRMIANKEPQVEGAGKDYTVSGKAITLNPRNFNIEVGDEVMVDYFTNEK
jgi:hypothetical protein